jgi:hypothetical protein
VSVHAQRQLGIGMTKLLSHEADASAGFKRQRGEGVPRRMELERSNALLLRSTAHPVPGAPPSSNRASPRSSGSSPSATRIGPRAPRPSAPRAL